MKIFKYRDTIDGNYAFVLAKTEEEAAAKLSTTTSINFHLIENRRVEDLKEPLIIINKILPF